MKIFKSFFIVTGISAFLFFLSFFTPAKALVLQPASGNFPGDETVTLRLLADPPGVSTAVQVKLEISNAIVTDVSSTNTSLAIIGNCDASQTEFRAIDATTYEVCIDIAKLGSGTNLTLNEELARITVTRPNSQLQPFTVTAVSPSGYLVSGGNITAVTGVLGSYNWETAGTAVSPTPVPSGTLPDTAISDFMPNKGVLGIAMVISGVISLGASYKVFVFDRKQQYRQQTY